jgi:hypothetical protein
VRDTTTPTTKFAADAEQIEQCRGEILITDKHGDPLGEGQIGRDDVVCRSYGSVIRLTAPP